MLLANVVAATASSQTVPPSSQLIVSGQTLTNQQISSPSTIRWYRFTLSGPALVTVHTSGDSEIDDTYISLFDSTSTLVLDCDDAPLSATPLYASFTYILVPSSSPATYYFAVASTSYIRAGLGATQPAVKLEKPFSVYFEATLLPTANQAATSLASTRLLQLVPTTVSFSVDRFQFAADTYQALPAARAASQPYIYERLANSLARLRRTLEAGGTRDTRLVFESPSGGYCVEYAFRIYVPPDPTKAARAELFRTSFIRFILQTEFNPDPQAEGAARLLRDELYAVGRQWSYAGTQTRNQGMVTNTPLTWTRNVISEVETLGLPTRRIRDLKTTTTNSYWLQGQPGNPLGEGLFLVKDGERDFVGMPVLHTPSFISLATDFVALPPAEMSRFDTGTGQNSQIFLDNYISYLGQQTIAVPAGSFPCVKTSWLRLWRDAVGGWGYSFTTEWMHEEVGLVRQQFHQFAFSFATGTSTTADGNYQLQTTNLTVRPSLEVDFDVDLPVRLPAGENHFAGGVANFDHPRWQLRLVNRGATDVPLAQVAFTSGSAFASGEPAGYTVVSPTEYQWNVPSPLAAGRERIFQATYAGGGGDLVLPVTVDRQWQPAIVNSGTTMTTTVDVHVQDGAEVDRLEIEIATPARRAQTGAADGAQFATVIHVAANGPVGSFAEHFSGTDRQTYRWTIFAPDSATTYRFEAQVRYLFTGSHQSATVEPIVRVGVHGPAYDVGGVPEIWYDGTLLLDAESPSVRQVVAKDVRLSALDSQITRPTVDFHYQAIPSTVDLNPSLPTPALDLVDYEVFQVGREEWRRYVFEVVNLLQFPDFLFAESSLVDLCEAGLPGHRTTVTLSTPEGDVLLADCRLDGTAGLARLIVELPASQPLLTQVKVELFDWLTGQSHLSDYLPVDVLGNTLVLRDGWNLLSFPTRIDRATADELLEAVFGADAFALPAWQWQAGPAPYYQVLASTGQAWETRAFWGYSAGIRNVDFSPTATPAASVLLGRGWQTFSIPAGSSLHVENVLATTGAPALWRWNGTWRRFERLTSGKLDHRQGYLIWLEEAVELPF